MAGEVYFEDNTLKIIDASEDAIEAALLECTGEIISAAKRNTRSDSGQLKNSWRGETQKTFNGYESVMGSPLENAIWEEFGTGEHAAKGNGRKGGWHIPAEKLSAKAKSKMQKRTIKGKEYYFTLGKMPTRAFQKAFDKVKPKIAKRFQEKFSIVFK